MESTDLLQSIPAQPQRQDSVSEQMADLSQVANRLGMYDAADAIGQMFETESLGRMKYGCHVEAEIEGIIDENCVLDYGRPEECIYAKPGMRREQCQYWRVIDASAIGQD
ncbi:hypothetical protein [Thioalkalivibrio sp. ALE23]|uniref:hypothetical protein n=1 Tax=Thioalkalivibrio sp. ALE23 TaxID=1265495 RepID=UPI0003657789|nr:hypothetical protein [Thioalkalivibrio sp. ALE23]